MSRWCDCDWHTGLIYPNDFGLVGVHLHNNLGGKQFVIGNFDEVTKFVLDIAKYGWKQL